MKTIRLVAFNLLIFLTTTTIVFYWSMKTLGMHAEDARVAGFVIGFGFLFARAMTWMDDL